MDTISIPRGIIVLLVRSVWVALTTVTLTVSYYLASIAEADSITARHAQSALTRDVSPNTTPSKEMGFDSDTSDACNERREEVNAETPRSQLYLFLQDLSSWGKTREPASSGTVQQHKHRRKHKGETPDTTKTLSHYATHEQDVQVKHNEEGSQNSLNGPISQLKQQAKTISLGEQAWWWEGLFEVDKRFFTHFYIFGTLMSLGSLVSVLYLYKADDTLIASTSNGFFCARPGEWNGSMNFAQSILGLLMMLCQTSRRMWECYRFEIPQNSGLKASSMHVAHYIVGMGFYALCCLSLLLELNSRETDQDLDFVGGFCAISGLSLFCWASRHQYECHAILFKLRMQGERKTDDSKPVSRYNVPHGDWFTYVSSPHYFAEILIYTSIYVATGLANYTWMLGISFVISNLGWGAYQSQLWYRRNFSDFPPNRKALVPYLW